MTLFMKATLLAFAIATTLPGFSFGAFVEHTTPPADLEDGWNTVTRNVNCHRSNCCEQCQGHCYNDADCRGADSPLVCYMREWEGPIDGCVGKSDNGKGYCIHPTGGYLEPDPSVDPRFLNIRPDEEGGNCTEAKPCEDKCEGSCENDDQCKGTNACWPLGPGENVKECNGYTGSPGTSYCGGSRPAAPTTKAPSASPAPTITDSPTWLPNRPKYGRLILVDECPPEGCPVCGGQMPGGCSSDADCATGLVCAERTGKELVSGCTGTGKWKANYCYAEDYEYLPPPLVQPEPHDEKGVYFFHDVELPEKCELYAADKGQKLEIPIGGSSGVGEPKRSYGEITYIYVMDFSRSTILSSVGACGDTHRHSGSNIIIDCEIMALEAINKATLESGNVDLVGLVQFGTTAEYVQDLVTPWAQKAEYSRDALIVEKAREYWPAGNTNFQAGIDQACQMASSDKNTNDKTVIIMISDGLPNRGTSTEDVIKNRCNNATVMTYAATAAASCSKIDVAKNIADGADPDTLNAIADYGGGTCTEVPDVTTLPDLLKALDATTFDGVRISVNDELVIDPVITYEVDPSFTGPKNTTYDTVVALPGPGEYEICLEATSSTSGEPEFDKKCTNLVVATTVVEPGNQVKSAEHDFTAEFTVSLTSLGPKPGCDVLSGQEVEIRDCEGKVLQTLKTDTNGTVTYKFGKDNQDPRVDCFNACFKDAKGVDSCTKTVVEWWDTPSLSPSSAPSITPSGKPSGAPSAEPSTNPTNSVAPSGAPSSSPSGGPSLSPSKAPSVSPSNAPSNQRSDIPSPSPSDRPSKVASDSPSSVPSASPSGGPTAADSSSPSASPSDSPSVKPSGGPTAEPSGSPSVSPSRAPSASPSNAPSSERSGAPSPNPSDRPSKEASNAPSQKPSDEPTGVPSDSPSATPSDSPSGGPTKGPSSSPSASPSNAPSTERSGVPSPSPSDRPTVVASDAPSDAPITPAPTTDAPVTAAPVTDAPVLATAPPVLETAAPSHLPSDTPSLSLAPSASPSKAASPYCNALEKDTCTLCEPFRSPDYCDPSESFPALVTSRTNKFRNQAQSVSDDGYWFHSLEDKIAGYLLTVEQQLLAPTIYCCVTKVDDLAACLKSNNFMSDDGALKIGDDEGNGIVIKATTFHSNQGVFILTNNTSLDPGQALDLHSNNAMTFSDIEAGLNSMQATKIIVEEFIGEDLPTEYKLHVVNGKVQAIDVIQDRGGDCGCYAVVDAEFNRLDYHGCFEPGGTNYNDPTNPECTSIDFDTGSLKAGPVKKDMYLCDTVAMPNKCVVDDMINMAETLGARIGVAMRVDMFVVGDTVYVQEYSPNPMNGLRHCAARVDENGCVDSCFLGREWKASGSGLYGGKATDAPTKLDGFLGMTNEAQCALIEQNAMVDSKFKSSCVVGTD